MRYSLLIAALAAGCVNATTRVVTVTDWTTTTVTETVTAGAVTTTIAAVKQAEVVKETSTEETTHTQAATSEISKSTVVVPQAEPTALDREEVSAETFYWTSAWTSTYEPTVKTSTSTSEAAPTIVAEVTSAAPVVVETPTSTLATTTAAAATATNAYQQKALYNHNVHRSNHTVSSLDWSADLEASAQALAAKCVYEHDTSIDGGGYGQNIGYGKTADEVGEMITNMMYNGEIGFYPGYGEADPSMTDFDAWGHFSQIVWKATTHVGCATVLCSDLGNVDASEAIPFTVCNYSPAGNVDTEYGANVLKPTGAATYVAS